jgi:hypothetical protein
MWGLLMMFEEFVEDRAIVATILYGTFAKKSFNIRLPIHISIVVPKQDFSLLHD